MIRFSVCCLIFSFYWKVNGQNYLKNGGFEKVHRYTNVLLNPFSDLDKVYYWDNPNRTSADIFKQGKTNGFLRLGQSFSYDGEWYMGLAFSGDGDRTEYAETKLKKTLVKDSLYCLSIHIMAGDAEGGFLSTVQAAFSEKYYHQREKSFFFLPDTVGFYDEGMVLNNTDEYRQLCAVYKAKGNENYFILGSFQKEKRFFYLGNPNMHHKYSLGGNYAYYYFDNISIEVLTNKNKCDCAKSVPKKKYDTLNELTGAYKNKLYRLRSTKFNSKTNKITGTMAELDQVVNILSADTSLKVKIRSHVFDSDNMSLNKKASKERSERIASYFSSQRIAKERVRTEGTGSRVPLFDHDTEKHRNENSRVEILFE